MSKPIPTLLVVDDEPINIKIIAEHLKDEGYKLIIATDGEETINLLEKDPEKYDAVLLDRIMPKLNGMEVLSRMKKHKILKTVPVIFQTQMDAENELMEGIKAGAYYYLTKPFKRDSLITVVAAAITEYATYKALRNEVSESVDALSLLKYGEFHLRTHAEGHKLATFLAKVCPQPSKVVVGLWELIINAVEHGNLNISYEEKSRLNEENTWDDEVKHRQALAENKDKKVTVKFEHQNGEIRFNIIDEGKGFDWHSYLELSPDRAFDSHGRGIAMAKLFSFDSLEYLGHGNEVVAVVQIQE